MSSSIPALLVGGRETRHLRVPKQTLPFGDTTVIGRTLRAYLDGGASEVILVLGYKGDQVSAQLGELPPKVRVVRNPLFDEGMGSFLRAGVRELPSDMEAFCIGLGDQPLLTAELVAEFLKAFREGKKKILAPAFQGSLGLPIVVHASLREEVQNTPPQGELWDLLKRHGDDLLDYPTGYSAVVRSIEDMDDYTTMLQMAGLPVPELPKAAREAKPSPADEPESETDSGIEAESGSGSGSGSASEPRSSGPSGARPESENEAETTQMGPGTTIS